MDDFTFDHAWELEGDYNWKAMADNYNEVGESVLEVSPLTALVLSLVSSLQSRIALFETACLRLLLCSMTILLIPLY